MTESPGAKWTAQQIVEAFPWDTAPRYLLRDRDSIYGCEFTSHVDHMGIKEVKTAPRSPWQSSYVERVIEIIRSTITVAGRISRSRKTPRNRGRWNRPTTGRSSSPRWSEDSIIGMHGWLPSRSAIRPVLLSWLWRRAFYSDRLRP